MERPKSPRLRKSKPSSADQAKIDEKGTSGVAREAGGENDAEENADLSATGAGEGKGVLFCASQNVSRALEFKMHAGVPLRSSSLVLADISAGFPPRLTFGEVG